MLSLPSPTLTYDLHPFVVRANRLRGAAAARLIRTLIRWVSTAVRRA